VIPKNHLKRSDVRLLVLAHSDDARRSLVSCWLQIMVMGTCRIRTQGWNRRYWCGIGQKPFEDQVSEWKISENSMV